MLCTIIYSEDLSVAITNIEDTSENALRERLGFIEDDDQGRKANYELMEKDGKRVHIFTTEEGYLANRIWVIEG